MSAIRELSVLVNALDKFAKLPIAEIAENKTMMREISEIFNVQGINQIINSIKNDMVAEKNERFYRAAEKTENKDFLHTFARFKHKEFEISSAGRDIAATRPVSFEMATAKNATAQVNRAEIEKQPEAKQWAEVYNSVFSDGAIKINVPGDSTRLNSYIDYSPYIFNYAQYLSVPTLSEFIDRPIDLAMKKPPEFEIKNHEAVEAFKKIIQTEMVEHVLRDYLLYSALSPRGSVLVPIQQNGRIRWNVFSDSYFSYGISSRSTSITNRYSVSKVGDIYCMGVKLVDRISCLFNCPGFEPLYAIGKNRMVQIKEAADAWNLYVAALKILLVRAQIIIQEWDGGGQTDTMLERLSSQLQRLSQTMGVSTPIEQPQGAKLDILNNNIGPGTADIAPVFQQLAGVLTGLAPEYFFGGSTTTYSASSFNIASTNENIHAKIQRPQLEPAWRFILNTHILFDERMKGFGLKEDDFEIKTPSIYEETEGERIDNDTKKINNLNTMRDYRELEEAYKSIGVLPKNITFKNLDSDKDADGESDTTNPEPLPDTDTATGPRPQQIKT